MKRCTKMKKNTFPYCFNRIDKIVFLDCIQISFNIHNRQISTNSAKKKKNETFIIIFYIFYLHFFLLFLLFFFVSFSFISKSNTKLYRNLFIRNYEDNEIEREREMQKMRALPILKIQFLRLSWNAFCLRAFNWFLPRARSAFTMKIQKRLKNENCLKYIRLFYFPVFLSPPIFNTFVNNVKMENC